MTKPPLASLRQAGASAPTSVRCDAVNELRRSPMNTVRVCVPSRTAIGWRWRTSVGMLPVTSPVVAVVLQPTSRAARLTNASARARLGRLFMLVSSGPRASIENEAVLAVVGRRGALAAGCAVDLVQATEQDGGRIGGV